MNGIARTLLAHALALISSSGALARVQWSESCAPISGQALRTGGSAGSLSTFPHFTARERNGSTVIAAFSGGHPRIASRAITAFAEAGPDAPPAGVARIPSDPRPRVPAPDRAERNATASGLLLAGLGGVLMLFLLQSGLFLLHREGVARDCAWASLAVLFVLAAQGGLLDPVFDWILDPERRLRGFRILAGLLALNAAWGCLGFQKSLRGALRPGVFALLATCALTLAGAALPGTPGAIAAAIAAVLVLGGFAFVTATALRRRLTGAAITTASLAVLLPIVFNLESPTSGAPFLATATVREITAIAALGWALLATLALTRALRQIDENRRRRELKEEEDAGLERVVRVLCHDLSAPLATVGMTADLLDLSRSTGRPVDLGVTSERMRRAYGMLQETIEAARNSERLKLHGGRLELEPVDLCEAVADVERMLKEKLSAKRLVLRRTNWPARAPVLADGRVLRLSIITNALSNAIKFSRPGEIIEISVRELPGGRVLVIRDRGIGIPRESRDMFARTGRIASRPGTMGEEGTGFGVTLMRDFTVAMRGAFRLESRTAEESPADHGTSVEIELQAPPMSR